MVFFRTLCLSVLLLVCVLSVSSNSVEGNKGHSTLHGSPHNSTLYHNNSHSDEVKAHGKHGPIERYPIITIDFERVQTPIIIGIWIFLACIGKIAFHMTPKLSTVFPESCMIILLGMVIGGVLYALHPDNRNEKIVSPLTVDLFFLYLLPPIIFDAGYFMPNRVFFDHLGTILMYAVVGTIWNAMTIGISLYAVALTGIFGDPEQFPILHLLLFSSLVSAVDPVAVLAVFEEIHVEEVLFILVFGESLLNDAVTVVLYHMWEGFSTIGENNIIIMDVVNGLISALFVSLGGTLIGVAWGFFAALVSRFTYQVQVIETVFIFVMSYLSYLNAELFHFSGILAITFCGITMKNYTEQNISRNSSTTIRYAVKMIASSSETVIFLFLGVATVYGTELVFNGWFILLTIVFCSCYRVLGTLMLTAVCNRFRVQKVDAVQKFVLCYAGIRGAVAFALAITIDKEHIPLAPTFVTATIAMVFFTVFVQGITIKPLVNKLGVKKSVKRDLKMSERLHERTMDYVMTGIDSIVGNLGDRFFRSWFKRINHKYITPLLVRENKNAEPKFFETLSHIKLQEAISNADSGFLYKETPSQATLTPHTDTKDWNIDLGERGYSPGDRDTLEEQFHHSLAEKFIYSKRRYSTYNRHAVTDSELKISNDFESKMLMKANKKAALQRIKNHRSRNKRGVRPNSSSSQLQLRKKLEEVESQYEMAKDNLAYIHEDDQVDFTDDYTKKRFDGSTAAESALPWRRGLDVPHEESQPMAQTLLPWKRNNSSTEDVGANESPFSYKSVAERTEGYHSPTHTFLSQIPRNNYSKLQEVFETDDASQKQDFPSMRKSALEERPVFRRRPSDVESSISGSMEHLRPRLSRSSTVEVGETDDTCKDQGNLSTVKEEKETTKGGRTGQATVVNVSHADTQM